MSNNVKNLKRGIKQSLGNAVQRQRAGRHGKPQVMRKRSVREVNGKVVMVNEWVPVPAEGYTRKVAHGPTANYGQQNKPENMAPRGK